MKWKEYQKLTPKQQNEYNFRFGEKPGKNVAIYLLCFLFFFKSMFISIIFTAYFIIQKSGWEAHGLDGLINAGIMLITLTAWTLLLASIEMTARICWHIYQEWKWRKANVPGYSVRKFWTRTPNRQ